MTIEELKKLCDEQASNPVIIGIIAHLESKEKPVKVVVKKVAKKVK